MGATLSILSSARLSNKCGIITHSLQPVGVNKDPLTLAVGGGVVEDMGVMRIIGDVVGVMVVIGHRVVQMGIIIITLPTTNLGVVGASVPEDKISSLPWPGTPVFATIARRRGTLSGCAN